MKTQLTNERKSGKKRVMVQIWSVIAKAIDKQFKEMHIKRDGYLNVLFTNEIELLAKEVTFRNSDKVRKLFRERPIPNRVKLNLDLDESLIKRIDQVLKEKNIPRDSFVNRILFFLIANERLLDYLGIDYDRNLQASAKPLDDAKGYLLNPFYHIRCKNDDAFYTLECFADGPFGDKGPNLFGLNSAIRDDSWIFMSRDEGLLAELDGLNIAEADHDAI